MAASILLLIAFITGAAHAAEPATLDLGYNQMYNLEFGEAHRTFEAYNRLRPDDPLGPVSNAAAYLFAEFDRLRVLQTEFFTQDDNFKPSKKLYPDPAVGKAFFGEMTKAEALAVKALTAQPKQTNALFAMIMIYGLRSDYDALIDKRLFSAFSAMKKSRAYANQLLAIDPTYYDAYMAVGVENYMLSLKPAPIRWIMQLSGAETDKIKGVTQLRFTMEKGHYLQPFARLLMAVASLRDHNVNVAKEILSSLAKQFPRNHLYAEELARLK